MTSQSKSCPEVEKEMMSKLDKGLKCGTRRQFQSEPQTSPKQGSHPRCEAPADNDLYVPVEITVVYDEDT